MPTYADACRRMTECMLNACRQLRDFTRSYRRMLTYADACGRMLTYADACRQLRDSARSSSRGYADEAGSSSICEHKPAYASTTSSSFALRSSGSGAGAAASAASSAASAAARGRAETPASSAATRAAGACQHTSAYVYMRSCCN
jgi:hypothetical protein